MENLKINQEKITDQDIKRVSKRWILASQITWNYEKMMGVGYLYAILPILRKLYKKSEDLKEMMRNHVQFFNTTPHMGGFILGIDAATEESGGKTAKDAASGIKTGLMGPFAGVGDTIFGVLIPTIFGSIAAYMGTEWKCDRCCDLAACQYCNTDFQIFYNRNWLPRGNKAGYLCKG